MPRSVFSTALVAITALAAGHDTVGAQDSRLPDDPKAPLYRYGDYRLPLASQADAEPLGHCYLAQANAPSHDYCAAQVPRTDAFYGCKGKPPIPEISIPSEPRSFFCD